MKFRSGERCQIRKVCFIVHDFFGSRGRRGERQSKRQRTDFDHVQTKNLEVGVHVRPGLDAVLGVVQHFQHSTRPIFFNDDPAVREEHWLDFVPFRHHIRAVRGFRKNEPMLPLSGRTDVPVGRELNFPPDLVWNVLSDFENGRKKGEFGRWILHELTPKPILQPTRPTARQSH